MKKLILILAIGGILIAALYTKYFRHGISTATPVSKKEKLSGQLREGDLIFQTSSTRQSKAIQQATHSKYSHMGIVFREKGELMVYEAVQSIKFTKLNEWINRGDGHRYAVRRLRKSESSLTEEQITKLREAGKEFLDKNYDPYFEWSDDRIYCSELVWKIYKRGLDIELGQIQPLGSFDLSSPEVKTKLKERYKNHIPLNEKVISPQAMFVSDKLETIADVQASGH